MAILLCGRLSSCDATIKRIILLFGSILLSFVTWTLFHYFRTKNWYKIAFVLTSLYFIVFLVYTLIQHYHLSYIFGSIANLKYFILSTGRVGMLLYIIIQAAQVVVLPIPAGVITLVGVAIWGPLLGAILNSVGVLLGSYLSFFLGRVFGTRLVSWIVGEDNCTKYANVLHKRGKFFLFYAFLLPFFPDDILCLISGITTMSFKYFFLISLLTRPVGVFCLAFFGGGYIIPFTGWGIIVWIILAVLIVASMIYLTKNQEKIEEKVMNILYSKKRKKHIN